MLDESALHLTVIINRFTIQLRQDLCYRLSLCLFYLLITCNLSSVSYYLLPFCLRVTQNIVVSVNTVS